MRRPTEGGFIERTRTTSGPPDELVEKAQRGHAASKEELIRWVYPIVFRWARSYVDTEADAEDLTHDVMVRALRSLDRFEGRSRFTTWLYQILKNTALDRGERHGRARARERFISDEQLAQLPGRDETADAEIHDLKNKVVVAFESLPYRQREVFDLHDLQGYQATEIAETLGISPSTVRVTLMKARRRIRAALITQGCAEEMV